MYSNEAYDKAITILQQRRQDEMILKTCLEAGICPVCGEELRSTFTYSGNGGMGGGSYYTRCPKDELHYNLASTKKPVFMK